MAPEPYQLYRDSTHSFAAQHADQSPRQSNALPQEHTLQNDPDVLSSSLRSATPIQWDSSPPRGLPADESAPNTPVKSKHPTSQVEEKAPSPDATESESESSENSQGSSPALSQRKNDGEDLPTSSGAMEGVVHADVPADDSSDIEFTAPKVLRKQDPSNYGHRSSVVDEGQTDTQRSSQFVTPAKRHHSPEKDSGLPKRMKEHLQVSTSIVPSPASAAGKGEEITIPASNLGSSNRDQLKAPVSSSQSEVPATNKSDYTKDASGRVTPAKRDHSPDSDADKPRKEKGKARKESVSSSSSFYSTNIPDTDPAMISYQASRSAFFAKEEEKQKRSEAEVLKTPHDSVARKSVGAMPLRSRSSSVDSSRPQDSPHQNIASSNTPSNQQSSSNSHGERNKDDPMSVDEEAGKAADKMTERQSNDP